MMSPTVVLSGDELEATMNQALSSVDEAEQATRHRLFVLWQGG